MFEVTMLPASEGDALLIRYGVAGAPSRVLIDVGRKATYRALLNSLPVEDRQLELLVISHIDRDHIEGALDLLGDEKAGFSFDDIWFNAYRHLLWHEGNESFGAVQGEKLTGLILKRDLPWNKAFDGGPVRIDGDAPVTRTLDGGLKITLLSPDAAKLAALEPSWAKECQRAEIDPSHAAAPEDAASKDPTWEQGVESFGGSLEDLAAAVTREDSAAPNGSSIAFLAEYEGKCVLFAADAHPSLLAASLDRLGRPLPLDCSLVKVAHHGSQANTTAALLERLHSEHWFISTNGTYFDHPDDVAIARILTSPAPGTRTLYFNYEQEQTRPWDESATQKSRYDYRCVFPTGDEPITLSL